MNIRLEYSDTEGKFNQAQATNQVEVVKGYKTLCCFVEPEKATRFIHTITAKYPQLNEGNGQPYPSHSTMRKDLFHFMAEEIKQLEEHMAITYKRRVQLFTKNNNT